MPRKRLILMRDTHTRPRGIPQDQQPQGRARTGLTGPWPVRFGQFQGVFSRTQRLYQKQRGQRETYDSVHQAYSGDRAVFRASQVA